jgi:hypothetical protein
MASLSRLHGSLLGLPPGDDVWCCCRLPRVCVCVRARVCAYVSCCSLTGVLPPDAPAVIAFSCARQKVEDRLAEPFLAPADFSDLEEPPAVGRQGFEGIHAWAMRGVMLSFNASVMSMCFGMAA